MAQQTRENPEIRRRGRLGALARLAAFSGCLLGLGLVAAVVKAQSEGRRASVQLGRGLVEMRELLGAQSELRINGNRMFAGAAHAELAPEAVLDRFEAHCREHGWQFSNEDTAALSRSLKAKAARIGATSLTLSRQRAEHEGAVVCLLAPEHSRGLSELMTRARRALETGKLSEVGDLRYVFARASAAGGSDVVTVWTEGAFNMKAFTERSQDAPGSDLPELHRPEGSRRVLDASLIDQQYGLKSYTMALAPKEALERFAHGLPRESGWREVDAGLYQAGALSQTFVKGGAALIFSAEEQDGKTRVNILQLRSRGISH